MKKRTIAFVTGMALTTVASASNEPIKLNVEPSNVQVESPVQVPKVGLRVGFGNWNQSVVNAGIDVTFKIPFVPIPELRFDAEAWSRLDELGGNVRGNAISLLGIKRFTLAYAGFGPTYYFTSDDGDHHSGLGLKLLGGLSWRQYYGEVSTIIGPSPTPVFVSVGIRF